MLNTIYIISWFGDDNVKERRKEFHKKQIEWAFKHNLKPVVLAQDYTAADYIDNVRYINADISNGILTPSQARNILLDEFYNSDDDFAFFADNDAVLSDDIQHSDSGNFIQLMRNFTIDMFADIDIISFANPSRTAFKSELSKPIYKNNFVFRRCYYTTGPIHIMKNIKKIYGKTLYYDVDTFNDNGKIITCEEHDFCINGMLHGIKAYHLRNVLLVEFGRTVSTWVNDDSNRGVDYAKQLINDKYKLELYIFPTNTEKTFEYIGHSLEPDMKTRKIRFADDPQLRTNICLKKGRSDIHFYKLPKPMTAPDILDYCISNNLFGIKEICDKFYKHKSVLKKSHTKIPVQFNWNVLPQFSSIKKIITVPKHANPENNKLGKFFSF